MFKDPKQRRIVLAASAAGVLALIAAWIGLQDPMFRMAAKPPGSFSTRPAPPAPDYTKPESWALRPAQPQPGGWEKPWGVDVFFIHPTSAYAGDDWNAPIDDKAANERLMTRILPNHAGPFQQYGPVYAPRYRQAALYAEMNVGKDSDGAFELAYIDVLAAFDHYVANENRGRGIILAGVGQGGLYVQKLLVDRFQGGALRDRLGAAYIIDAALPADAPEKMFIQPVCDAYTKIQCVEDDCSRRKPDALSRCLARLDCRRKGRSIQGTRAGVREPADLGDWRRACAAQQPSRRGQGARSE